MGRRCARARRSNLIQYIIRTQCKQKHTTRRAVLATEPLHKFRLQINTEDYNDTTEANGLACQLAFTYTARYPDEPPLVEIEDAVNFADGFTARLLAHIGETVGGLLLCMQLQRCGGFLTRPLIPFVPF